MDIKEATEFIFEELYYAYCNNCKGNFLNGEERKNHCDGCNRKAQNWAISEQEANRIAKNILSK